MLISCNKHRRKYITTHLDAFFHLSDGLGLQRLSHAKRISKSDLGPSGAHMVTCMEVRNRLDPILESILGRGFFASDLFELISE